ncbi:hypothetical protein ACFTAO_42795 [Paenibacillus rhizoplanae]
MRKIVNLMEIYPDTYIVTDTKELEAQQVTKQFQLIVEAARKKDPALLERIVPQIYSREMLEVVKQVYAFSRNHLYPIPDRGQRRGGH